MTLTFPMAMPRGRILKSRFELERVDYDAPESGGMLGGISAGLPRWELRLTFNNLLPEEGAALGAWIDAQRGSQRRFVGFDIDRRRPFFYGASRPFAAAPTGWSQAINGNGLALLTLTGLFPGQAVAPRDYVGFSWTGGRMALVRSLERVFADAGGSATFAIEPPVPTPVPGGATITLREAGCLMKLVPGETKLADSACGYFEAGSTIVARQAVLQ